MLAAPSTVGSHSLSTATHLKLLLEVLVLVGWVEEQEGAPGPLGWVEGQEGLRSPPGWAEEQEGTVSTGPFGGVEPILMLLKLSLENAKREEREAFVATRGKLLLSVLQLLLRKVGAVGGGDSSGVVEGGREAERVKQLRMVLDVVSLLAAAAHGVGKEMGHSGDTINEVCEGSKRWGSTSGGVSSSSGGGSTSSSSTGRASSSSTGRVGASSSEAGCGSSGGGGVMGAGDDDSYDGKDIVVPLKMHMAL